LAKTSDLLDGVSKHWEPLGRVNRSLSSPLVNPKLNALFALPSLWCIWRLSWDLYSYCPQGQKLWEGTSEVSVNLPNPHVVIFLQPIAVPNTGSKEASIVKAAQKGTTNLSTRDSS
jgi:hypothetical protein